jgi:hypothetical protein
VLLLLRDLRPCRPLLDESSDQRRAAGFKETALETRDRDRDRDRDTIRRPRPDLPALHRRLCCEAAELLRAPVHFYEPALLAAACVCRALKLPVRPLACSAPIHLVSRDNPRICGTTQLITRPT